MTQQKHVIRILQDLSDIARADWDRVANPYHRNSYSSLIKSKNINTLEEKTESSDKEKSINAPNKTHPKLFQKQEADQQKKSNCQELKAESKLQDIPYNPFISYDFLRSLEESNCVCAETGWLPQHLILEQEDGALIGAMPCYLKSHSQGEYVFDHAWAEALEHAGMAYYPKLQVGVPFTPVTGQRLLVQPGPNAEYHRQLLAAGGRELTHRLGVSSLHATFMTKSEWDIFSASSYLPRTDQQFHWLNTGYDTFDDFLLTLTSRKRKQLKRERSQAQSHDITIEWLSGSDLHESHWDAFFQFYLDTATRKWGYPYLNRDFFSLINERMANHILLIMAKRNGRYIAGALNLYGPDTLYGRYWGCSEHHPFLHFEICYYQAIDFAILNNIKRVEAGAQGSHKLIRGYTPCPTYSAHFIANANFRTAIANYLEEERQHVALESDLLRQHLPFKDKFS